MSDQQKKKGERKSEREGEARTMEFISPEGKLYDMLVKPPQTMLHCVFSSFPTVACTAPGRKERDACVGFFSLHTFL